MDSSPPLTFPVLLAGTLSRWRIALAVAGGTVLLALMLAVILPPTYRGTASFVTDLRRETTGLLRDRLGEQRLRELRAEGGVMNTDEAVAYVLDAVADYQRAAD